MAFNGLSSVLGMKPVTLYMPVMTDGVFAGVVDILGGKALMFGENGAVTEALIPDAIADEAALLHDTTVENIAESDEELMEKYLEEGSLSEEDLASGLRKGVLNASLVPVVVGSSLENKGGRELLDAIARLFPSPLERPAFLDADGTEAYADALANMAARNPGMRILAISHDPTMKARFPQNIIVQGGENGSSVSME